MVGNGWPAINYKSFDVNFNLRQRSLNSGFPVTFGPGDEGGGGDINKNDQNL